ncbi:unnamed protein product [Brassicogethes aeneus]|uniref:Sensory neuron membrane protein 2 n=1 Tax=Brassicogethes aeneus TaxID=1431903 RepID=A0A9P0FBC4_BRAAE|nr:unnamed protein product [Brassicogethes aeneus]
MGLGCCSIRAFYIYVLISIGLLVGSLVIAFSVVPPLIKTLVEENVRLENNTEQWERFIKLPFSVDFKVYFFEVTNPEEVLTKKKKPILQEKGPYTYKQTRSKTVISQDDDEDTVTYEEYLDFKFSPEDSVGMDNDSVQVFNTPMLAVIQKSDELSLIERLALSSQMGAIFKGQSLIQYFEIKKILFEGLEFAKKQDCKGTRVCSVVRSRLIKKAKVIKNIKEEDDALKFSFFNYKLNKPDGNLTVKRGLHDIHSLGNIIKWKNVTDLSIWGNPKSTNNQKCSRVRGTDSTLFHPDIESSSVSEIFSTDLCRAVDINYSGKDSYKGIEGFRFQIDKNTVWFKTNTSEEDCFCTKQTKNMNNEKDCFLDGIVDMQPCIGSPILFSLPHFLHADKKYINTVEGIDPPVPENFETFLVVEPNTGVPLKGTKRFQLNMVLRPQKNFKETKNLITAVVPLLWIEEGIELPEKYVQELREIYFDKVKIADIAKYTFIALTALATCASGGFLIYKIRKSKLTEA